MTQVENSDLDVPDWDVALEALAKEEYGKSGNPLNLEDFERLAKEYTIRLDDIMMTMFELVIQGRWQYQGEQVIERDTLNNLYVNGRLHAKDLAEFTGAWSPASN